MERRKEEKKRREGGREISTVEEKRRRRSGGIGKGEGDVEGKGRKKEEGDKSEVKMHDGIINWSNL